MERIENSPCKEVFEYFQEMNKIPRGSGNEKGVSDWLVKFAKDHDLEVIQDDVLNVIIKKPGTPGYEDSDIVILQGHMDMVPEKEADSDHDFEKDPIAFIVDGDNIHADKTTLGADNGIAVSYALAILASDDIPHPPLEVLITTSEETGMDGAFGLDAKNLEGRRLLNIDSEVEGQLLVSSSGGVGATLSLGLEKEEAKGDKAMTIIVDGLKGGHSGMEIDKQRGSANQLLGRVLYNLAKDVDYGVEAINGGSKHNAIPRKAEAKIVLDSGDVSKLEDLAKDWTEKFRVEFRGIDDEVQVRLEEREKENLKVWTQETRDRAIAILNLVPIGVLNVSFDIEGLVQTSNNLGVVVTEEDKITFESAIRSSVKTMKYEIADRIEQIGKLTQAEVELSSDYPEWSYNPDSELRDAFIKTYKDQYGEEPEVTAIHAGLECGLFSDKFDGKIDVISFGPNLHDVHTPKERMEIGSVERTYELLKGLLKNLK